ncbi:hypothetical protein DYB30_007802, partial [Aphanomyces astaci]
NVCLRIAEADKKLGDGASEYMQLLDVAAFLMRTSDKKSPALLRPAFGCLYIVLSVLCSCGYLALLHPSLSNDVWWHNYTTSVDQALAIDMFNTLLATQTSGPVDLLAPRATVDKLYSTSSMSTFTSLQSTRGRRLVTTELTSIPYAVENLRALDPVELGWMGTQYCWVDFDRQFELAHTSSRQRRCLAHYKRNGAVYLEAVVRNQNWANLMTHIGGDDGLFTVAILDWLDQTEAGQRWITATSNARITTTVADEVAYWEAHLLTSFTLQWQNDFITGLSDLLTLENALGMQYNVLLSRMPSKLATWTSIVMYCAFYNDMYFMHWQNRSLIRSANNSFLQAPPLNYEVALGMSEATDGATVQIRAFRTIVGPFFSVDTWILPVPLSAVDMYQAFQTEVRQVMSESASVETAVSTISVATTLMPTPLAWSDQTLWFFGGNPMCLYGQPQRFLQQTFGFDDSCDDQLPLTVVVTRYAALFSVLVMKQHDKSHIAETMCSLDVAPRKCQGYINTWTQVRDLIALPTLLSTDQVLLDIRALDVGIMQFASSEPSSTEGQGMILFQRLLDASAFDFYSWVMVFDWIEGLREVVRFDGDAQSMTLMSMRNVPVAFASSSTYVSAVSRGIIYFLGYVSMVLTVVGIWCVLATVSAVQKSSRTSPNLVWFNHVVGAVWIGRPLLLLRGVTAILFLSTAQLHVTTGTTSSSSRFELQTRSWLDTAILAGEATWVLYVAVDFLTIVSRRFTRMYAPVAYVLSWGVLVGLEVVDPVVPIAWTQRMCTSQDMDQALSCSSAVLQIGSYQRVWKILLLQVLALGGGVVVASVVPPLLLGVTKKPFTRRRRSRPSERHVLSVAASLFFPLEKPTSTTSTSLGTFDMPTIPSHDVASWLMAGLVPLPWRVDAIFDIKVWLLHGKYVMPAMLPVKPSTFRMRQDVPVTRPSRWSKLIRVGVALLYVVVSLGSSLWYLEMAQAHLQNDLMWANYNITGVHTFIATWLNEQLALGTHQATVYLHSDDISDDNPDSEVVSAPNGGASLQYSELSTLDATITGLQTTDACSVPWIFTQYCFVDFNQRWELANTEARQRRCLGITANGAVFLESILRNVDYVAFRRCWGDAFDVAIANEVQQSVDGRNWLSIVSATTKLSVVDEIAVWTRHGIRHFQTQWQNFKTIGFTNEYAVVNAFGMVHTFELTAECAAFRLEKQTTMKMYWALANDLLAVSGNGTTISGRGLIRSSASFAFENSTVLEILVQQGLVLAPLPHIFAVVNSDIGPFGSVDMTYIGCPASVKSAIQSIFAALSRSLAKRDDAQLAYANIINGMNILNPIPAPWIALDFWVHGGSMLCPGSHPVGISQGLLEFTSLHKQCSSVPLLSTLYFSRKHMVAASVLSQSTLATPELIARTCSVGENTDSSCAEIINRSVAFASDVLAPHLAVDMSTIASNAIEQVMALNVELIQFGTTMDNDEVSPLRLFRTALLDPVHPEFTFFAWIFLIDWARGSRDVVQFAGDRGNVTLLTDFEPPLKQPVNLAQYPGYLSKYLLSAMWYSTLTAMFVAALMVLYLAISKGYVEAANLYEFQRVGSIVWIGRPFLIGRCITAMGLLASASLELRYSGHMTYIESVQVPWFKTLLAANEFTWHVAILNDIGVVVTQEYTVYYATINSVLVGSVAALVSFNAPILHAMVIDKQCHVQQVDFSVVCTSGYIAIGQLSRVVTLVVVVLACNVLCYVATRQMTGKPEPTALKSVFLYAGAKYMFSSAEWISDGMYYMDRMSAAMNGIVTVRYANVMYGLDMKLWCTFQVDVSEMVPHTRAAQFALPLRLTSEY